MIPMIHSSALIDPSAEIADNVEIGPGTIVGPRVSIGEGTKIRAHSQIMGYTKIGCHCDIFPNVIIGAEPQDLSYKGEETWVRIGDHNIIREFTTINRGTPHGGGITEVGSHCLVMTHVHIAHDCRIGDNCILTNLTQMAGHVVFEPGVISSTMVAIHQFTTIGAMAFLAPRATIRADVPPYMIVDGNPARARALNIKGLQRKGVDPEAIRFLKDILRQVRRNDKPRQELIKELEADPIAKNPYVKHLINFYRASGEGAQGRAQEAQRHAH